MAVEKNQSRITPFERLAEDLGESLDQEFNVNQLHWKVRPPPMDQKEAFKFNAIGESPDVRRRLKGKRKGKKRGGKKRKGKRGKKGKGRDSWK